MKAIDLSHKIENNMTVYPGSEKARVKDIRTIEKDGFREKNISILSHVGTHVDAPGHVLKNGKLLDEFPIDKFMGKAIILDFRELNGRVIGREELKGAIGLEDDFEFIIIKTGWSKHWKDEKYFDDYPVLSEEAAHYLTGLNLKGLGMDTISVDEIDSERLVNHHILLGKEIVLIENLNNIEEIGAKHAWVSFVPLKIDCSDGGPCRAYAIK